MTLANTKKCQTFINALAEEAQRIQAASSRLAAIRAKYIAESVDPTGTPLAGNETTVSTWIDSVQAVASNAITTAVINAKVPTHRGQWEQS